MNKNKKFIKTEDIDKKIIKKKIKDYFLDFELERKINKYIDDIKYLKKLNYETKKFFKKLNVFNNFSIEKYINKHNIIFELDENICNKRANSLKHNNINKTNKNNKNEFSKSFLLFNNNDFEKSLKQIKQTVIKINNSINEIENKEKVKKDYIINLKNYKNNEKEKVKLNYIKKNSLDFINKIDDFNNKFLLEKSFINTPIKQFNNINLNKKNYIKKDNINLDKKNNDYDKYLQSLILVLKSNFFPFPKKINIIISSTLLYKEFNLCDLKNELKINLIKILNLKINLINSNIQNYILNNNSKIIIDLIIIIYIFLNENYYTIPSNFIIYSFFNIILKKFVKSEEPNLKNFLFYLVKIIDNIKITKDKIYIIENIFNKYANILNNIDKNINIIYDILVIYWKLYKIINNI